MGKKLTSMLLNGRSQSEKAAQCVIPTVRHSGKGKTKEAKEVVERSVVAARRAAWGEMNRNSTEAF